MWEKNFHLTETNRQRYKICKHAYEFPKLTTMGFLLVSSWKEMNTHPAVFSMYFLNVRF